MPADSLESANQGNLKLRNLEIWNPKKQERKVLAKNVLPKMLAGF